MAAHCYNDPALLLAVTSLKVCQGQPWYCLEGSSSRVSELSLWKEGGAVPQECPNAGEGSVPGSLEGTMGRSADLGAGYKPGPRSNLECPLSALNFLSPKRSRVMFI